MMSLTELLSPWMTYQGAQSVKQLQLDSRKVEAGDLFIAVPGHVSDGRQYVETALAQGACAALVHTDDAKLHGTQHQGSIYFFDLAKYLSQLAARRYSLAGRAMRLVGVTGTNGKTSVSQFIAQLTESLGLRAAVMGTLGNGHWGELIDSGNTTADAVTMMRQLSEFSQAGIDVCAMEVSSHGLVQGRVAAVPFDIAVFTNLSRDHLDYHGDMASYAAAKLRLFSFPTLKFSVLNLDDACGENWQEQELARHVIGYSLKGHAKADYQVISTHYHDGGVDATIAWPGGQGQLSSPLLGEFNLANLLAALTCMHLQGHDMQALLAAVPSLKPVAGRMERFNAATGQCVVVDYAHTPDALEQALKALKVHCRGKLWCIFGCGGDRDKGKRPLMAKAAEAFADKVMVTSDNARSEDPIAIISDVLAGFSDRGAVLIEADRVAAIKSVFAKAGPQDLILLAGKGHETYQEYNGVKHHYDEREFAAQLVSGVQQ
ncbi:UDP-N-acetylmuramoyl-L-alanyl-D-glutamate--2,6-diaminopimelate ligase [Shewanella sp. SNU WT4]|uniref:UDP-N-acetylmuramoyl-L-alanyl-D-glutamate--2, 6-diaminopimelate ligase n=1 Tax=Shewanella sp. SNU WT4 TaxID=2590015 RepID=UPI0011264D3C|nr:UDP-N-acetylmuramoyl-L-alanyl-D-glutamate--2,6-diaminopimelate ligase [Shewanella sp. SNU WT4]QDF65678.1 UDP-N-acetylmuramoyl-L-alanyl-D-glutamate--2,6-diaminopimelate ligase [Shewanella sp. SNU WT4]